MRLPPRASRALRLCAADDVDPVPLPSKKPDKRDAYDAFSSPDSAWSTISAKKRKEKGKDQRKDASIQKFKLRLRTVPPNNNGRKSYSKRDDVEAAPAEAKPQPRVTLYLPPPPKPQQRDSKPLPASQLPATRQGGSDDLSPPSFRPMAIRRVAPAHMSLSAYRAPTQGRRSEELSSDSLRDHHATYEGEDEAPTLTFDEGHLSHHYQHVRRAIAERKRLAAETWDLLDLPSCGVVFQDEWRAQPETTDEIRIICWAAHRRDT
ncbi:hypothetical protein BD310DRAFT_962748 [Dichomitus squalens]|uniref:Uncharacterized protein n=1 Tax=Dichomitus squalens TaxID=114155 RepID=A0A4Q9PH99_9APHY|nr:hypothetical protein BD310DRAFT_962748 [Dichomitus squalens]